MRLCSFKECLTTKKIGSILAESFMLAFSKTTLSCVFKPMNFFEEEDSYETAYTQQAFNNNINNGHSKGLFRNLEAPQSLNKGGVVVGSSSTDSNIAIS